MITPVDFAFVSAKLHGMRSKLYEGERIAALTSLRNAFEMAAVVFPSLDVRSRMRFERTLVEEHVRDLVRIRTFLDGGNRHFFDWQLERYRLENLKVLLRGWKTRVPQREIEELLVELPPDYALPVAEVLATDKINDVIRLMPCRPFARGIRRGVVQFHDSDRLYFIEAGLDAEYFEELCRRARLLGMTDRRQVVGLVRREVLIYNVLFVMRAKLNYGVPEADVREFIVTGPAPATENYQVVRVLQADGFDAMRAALPERKTLLGSGEDPVDLAALQRRLWERLHLAANRLFYTAFFHMGCVEAFYYIKRIELQNLIRVAELLRQEQPPSQIQQQLIRLPES
ncbi:MAG TPA: V-type ATPase subunit [Planctomycetota bacterium]|nr:V-type ATPase subunit [Planctomycetota bacterium]